MSRRVRPFAASSRMRATVSLLGVDLAEVTVDNLEPQSGRAHVLTLGQFVLEGGGGALSTTSRSHWLTVAMMLRIIGGGAGGVDLSATESRAKRVPSSARADRTGRERSG